MKPLIERLDKRLGQRDDLSGNVTISDASAQTVDAITGLLGKTPTRSGRITLRLQDLDKAIKHATGVDLAGALTIILGRPPSHPATDRRAEQEHWDQARTRWMEGWQDTSDDVLCLLRSYPKTRELIRITDQDLESARALMEDLRRCLTRLPLPSPAPLPIFATETLGDAHALDGDRTFHRLLRDAIEALHGDPSSENRKRTRDVFGDVGIVLDELASTVLVLNLRPRPDGWVGRYLNDAALAGEPIRLTFRQLGRNGLRFDAEHALVSVCENPSVMATAADQLGASCRPLICVEGFPSHAALALIGQIIRAGNVCRYHGDFDPAGIQIAHGLIVDHGMKSWRMDAEDYESVVAKSTLTFPDRIGVIPTPWSPTLQMSLQEHRTGAIEEMVLETLLEDLCAEGGSRD
ncbi:MAG: TIGR02679 family protein [Planctomycetota bacterium]